MTAKEKLVDMCTVLGMFPDQAKEVVDLAIHKIDALVPDYQITWDCPWDEYLEVAYDIWFHTVAECAVEWIDENCPEAWFREMFV